MPVGNPHQIQGNMTELKIKDWIKAGIKVDEDVTLTYASGVQVTGRVKSFQTDSWGNVKVIKFASETAEVKFGSQILFSPEWGEYDLLIGNKVINTLPSPF